MPKLNDYEKDALKQKLPEYMAMYGIQLKPNKNILCINPAHNDTTPSMGYKADEHYLHCFSCGESYDIFAACASRLKNILDIFASLFCLFRYSITGRLRTTRKQSDLACCKYEIPRYHCLRIWCLRISAFIC